MPAFTAVAVAAVAPTRSATAIGVSSMFRQVGATLGVAAFVAIVATPTRATAIDAYRHGWLFMAGAAGVGAVLMLAARLAPLPTEATAGAGSAAEPRLAAVAPPPAQAVDVPSSR